MSTFSDRLNAARGDESIRSVARRAATKAPVGESTLYPYFRDGHPRPTMAVVVALAMALRIPSQELRELADIPAEGHVWMPPAEARYMNDRQRHAVDELIRSFVATQGATDADLPAAESPAATEGAEDQARQGQKIDSQPLRDLADYLDAIRVDHPPSTLTMTASAVTTARHLLIISKDPDAVGAIESFTAWIDRTVAGSAPQDAKTTGSVIAEAAAAVAAAFGLGEYRLAEVTRAGDLSGPVGGITTYLGDPASTGTTGQEEEPLDEAQADESFRQWGTQQDGLEGVDDAG